MMRTYLPPVLRKSNRSWPTALLVIKVFAHTRRIRQAGGFVVVRLPPPSAHLAYDRCQRVDPPLLL